MLLNPSGIPHADGLVALRARYDAMPDLNNISMSAPDFGDAAAGKNIFSSAAVMQAGSFNYARENGNPELLNGARVSSGWFDTFDVRPYLGRVFTPEEDQPGAGNEAVLSYRTWKKRFGSDPNIVGQTLMLNNQSFRVVGVMGPIVQLAKPGRALGADCVSARPLSRPELPLQRKPVCRGAAAARRNPAAG